MDEFYRIKRLPPYVFAIVNDLKTKARARGEDMIDLGMGNPDKATPPHIVDKLVEAAQNPKNHRYSSRGITGCEVAIANGIATATTSILTRTRRHRHDRGQGRPGAFRAVGDRAGAARSSPTRPIRSTPTRSSSPGAICAASADAGPGLLRRLHDGASSSGRGRVMMIISFPHNPTARVVDRDFFEKVVDFARENDVIVVHDFAYADIVFDGYRRRRSSRSRAPRTSASSSPRCPRASTWRGGGSGFARETRADRGPGADEELFRLRDLPAHPDRLHHRADGGPEVRRRDRGQLRKAA